MQPVNIYFPAVQRTVDRIAGLNWSGAANTPLAAAVVTSLGLDPTQLGPGFWYGEFDCMTDLVTPGQAFQGALDWAAGGLTEPVLWCFGLLSRQYWRPLAGSGLLSREAEALLNQISRLPYLLPVILRAPWPVGVHYPGELGYVGGLSFAFFNAADEPLQVYRDWLGLLRGGREGIEDYLGDRIDSELFRTSLFSRNLTAPVGTSAFIAPFGRENWPNAIVARAGKAPDLVAREISVSAGLALALCSYTEPEFWDLWDRQEILEPRSLSGIPTSSE
jgi:hypothetical protein